MCPIVADVLHIVENQERDRTVHAAIQTLPDTLRTVTALYFIGGISQREVGDCLGLTESAVKKRLFNDRGKLREYVMNMANSISEERMSAEKVSARVIAELISGPQPLLVKDHPIRKIVDEIESALLDYELIESQEVEESEIYPSIQEAYYSGCGTGYRLDSDTMLRTQTSGATLRAIEGRRPPVRLLTAGRVYQPEVEEDAQHLKVFHQLDAICVEPDASVDKLRLTLKTVLSAVVGPVEVRYRDHDYGWVDQGMDVDVKMKDEWLEVAGCGTLRPAMLSDAGHDPGEVQGYAFGLGLERMAELKLGLKSVHELWRHPYLQPQP